MDANKPELPAKVPTPQKEKAPTPKVPTPQKEKAPTPKVTTPQQTKVPTSKAQTPLNQEEQKELEPDPNTQIEEHYEEQQPQANENANIENPPQENQPLPEGRPIAVGDKSIKCWNCESVLLVKEEWNVVQCPSCQRMNKVPKAQTDLEKILSNLRYNSYVNHFDTTVPYVFVIVVCPFCKADNKVRSTSEHMVCYVCKNSVNIAKEKYDTSSYSRCNNSLNPNSHHYLFNAPQEQIQRHYPPPKTLRFSDIFFPDPMFYPGYYPINSLSPLYPDYFNPYDNRRFEDRKKKWEKYKVNLQLDENFRTRNEIKGYPDRYALLAKLKEISDGADKVVINKASSPEPSLKESRSSLISKRNDSKESKGEMINKMFFIK